MVVEEWVRVQAREQAREEEGLVVEREAEARVELAEE